MKKMTLGIVCSGGGGVETGALMQGIAPIWSIDFNPKKPNKLNAMVSHFNELNTGTEVVRKPLQEINEKSLYKVDVMWGSLPCDRATLLKNIHNNNESSLDIKLADKFIQLIKAVNPSIVVLENVPGWEMFQSFTLIHRFLKNRFRWVYCGNYEMTDYGVPQKRKRFIVRSSSVKEPEVIQTVDSVSTWYSAIESEFGSLSSIELQPKIQSYIENRWKIDWNWSETFLVENCGVLFSKPKLVYQYQPAIWCLRASPGVDHRGNPRNRSVALWLPEEQSFYALDSRCYARLGAFLDWYSMPKQPGYALYIVGLSVPPLFVKAVFNSVLPDGPT